MVIIMVIFIYAENMYRNLTNKTPNLKTCIINTPKTKNVNQRERNATDVNKRLHRVK